MFKRLGLVLGAFLLLALPLEAQITVPNNLVPGAVIRANELNTNFSAIGTKALNRITGGQIEGNITILSDVTVDGVDISDFLISTGEVRANTAGSVGTPAFSRTGDTSTGVYFPTTGQWAVSLSGTQRLLLNGGGLTIYGNTIINNLGKIPALSSTYFSSLDGSNLTNVALLNTANSFTNTQNITAGPTNMAINIVADAAQSVSLLRVLDSAGNIRFRVGSTFDVSLRNSSNVDTFVAASQTGNITTPGTLTVSGLSSLASTAVTAFRLGTSATAGHVLTTDASGNGTWQASGIASGAVPSGLIAMFDTSCPATWTRVSAWDNKFVRGGSTYVLAGGGADTHTHSVDPASTTSTSSGSHTHTISTDGAHTHSVDVTVTTSSAAGGHAHNSGSLTNSNDGAHSHTGTTDNAGDHSHTITTTGVQTGAGSDGIADFNTSSAGTHNHSFSTSSNGTHGHNISGAVESVADHTHSVDPAAVTSTSSGNHNHTNSSDGAHTHATDIASFTSGSGANVPVYVQVVFCKKD